MGQDRQAQPATDGELSQTEPADAVPQPPASDGASAHSHPSDTAPPQPQAQPGGDAGSAQPEPPGPAVKPPQRIDWMKAATVVAALAAAGGLIFSAWTSYYSVQTAQDQLDQSREDADRELRQQAVLVSTWTQIDGSNAARGEPGVTTGYIANRSLDPIDQVVVGLSTELEGDPRTFPLDYKEAKTMLYLGALPPCSRVTLPAIVAKHQLGPGTPLEVSYHIPGVSFIDVYGQQWARPSSGPLQPLNEGGPVDSKGNLSAMSKVLFEDEVLELTWTLAGASNTEVPAPEPLEECGPAK